MQSLIHGLYWTIYATIWHIVRKFDCIHANDQLIVLKCLSYNYRFMYVVHAAKYMNALHWPYQAVPAYAPLAYVYSALSSPSQVAFLSCNNYLGCHTCSGKYVQPLIQGGSEPGLNGLDNLYIPTSSLAICFLVARVQRLVLHDTERSVCPQAAAFHMFV